MNIEELQETGAALLALARNRLTGKEIESCEWTQSDDFENDSEIIEMEEPDEPGSDDYDDKDEFKDDHDEWKSECESIRKIQSEFDDRITTLSRLRVEFYAQITGWIDSNNREESRKAIETHSRLHTQAA